MVARPGRKSEEAREEVLRCGELGGGSVDLLTADLSRMAEVRWLSEEVLQNFPDLEVLINNAAARRL